MTLLSPPIFFSPVFSLLPLISSAYLLIIFLILLISSQIYLNPSLLSQISAINGEGLFYPKLVSDSDLPENVIDEILSRLPTKDAGRTAVLSRSWRHRWRSIPDLDLSAVSDLGVSQALRLHVGPIRLFKVDPTRHGAIDGWLATLSSSSSGCLRTLDLTGDYPLQLGTLARFFPRLAHLRLVYTDMDMLRELVSSEFAFLQTLHLDHAYAVDILDYSTDDESDSIGDGEASGSCNLIKLLGGMPCIKRLHLGRHALLMFLGKGHVPQKFPVSFDHLRYMSLKTDLKDIRVLQVILCLLRSTPNLHELDFEGTYSSDMKFPGVVKDFWKTQEHQEHLGLFDNLERVKVTNNCPCGAELQFIQFILSKARVLKTVMVSFPDGPIREKLLMSPTVSNHAKILFTR